MLLYTYPENFRAFKALIAAQYSGANLKIAPNFVFGETNKSEAFLKKFPLGKVSVSARSVNTSRQFDNKSNNFVSSKMQFRG